MDEETPRELGDIEDAEPERPAPDRSAPAKKSLDDFLAEFEARLRDNPGEPATSAQAALEGRAQGVWRTPVESGERSGRRQSRRAAWRPDPEQLPDTTALEPLPPAASPEPVAPAAEGEVAPALAVPEPPALAEDVAVREVNPVPPTAAAPVPPPEADGAAVDAADDDTAAAGRKRHRRHRRHRRR